MAGCCDVIHGMCGTRIYNTWLNMKSRCCNKNNKEFANYGGRGIKVCDEWRNSFSDFYDWALTSGYSDNLTIERVDVNGDYCPENCTWILKEEQASNTTRNNRITYNGETKTISQWARLYGINLQTLRSRLYSLGYSFEEAIQKDKGRSRSDVFITFKNKKYTQTEFADLCGCSKHWIYRMRKQGYAPEEMYIKTEKFRIGGN